MHSIWLFLLLLVLSTGVRLESVDIDESGYLAFCPCMGRFGNQMEQFLGVLAFAKGLNRTLILPPLIEYRTGEIRSIQVPFDKYFEVEPLREYHRVILMHDFMDTLAPTVWPPEERISFCYMERSPITKEDEAANEEHSCNAKSGNPFGPFWDEFNVDFVRSAFFGPLNYDVHHGKSVEMWQAKFPASQYPVLAFSGAPASFPVQKENVPLQKYFKLAKTVQAKADAFIHRMMMPKGAYIGVHLRNGMDWVRACEHVDTSANLFSSPQCLGYMNEFGNLTMDLCMPSRELIVRQLKRHIKTYKETHKDAIKYVYVASDKNHMVEEFQRALERLQITVVQLEGSDPVLDLTLLIKSNFFIGNCVSSYTAFAKRSRDAIGMKSAFWGFPAEKGKQRNKFETVPDSNVRDEL